MEKKQYKFNTALAFISLCALALSFGLLYRLPVQLMPNLKSTQITVESYWSNASTEDVANELLYPIAQKLSQLKHLQDIASFANPGYGYTQLSFASEQHATEAREDVNALLNGIDDLPQGVKRPYISEGDESDATGWIFLQSKSDDFPASDQLEYVEKQLLPQIRKIQGIRTAYVLNRYNLQRKVIVNLNLDHLRHYEYSVEDVAERLRQVGNYALGDTLQSGEKIALRLNNNLSLEEIGLITFTTKNNLGTFHLSELGEISAAVTDKVDMAYYNGTDVVPIVFYLDKDANLLSIYENIEEIKQQFNSEILKNTNYYVSDFGNPIDVIEITRQKLITSMLFGLLLTAAFIFIFYRNTSYCLSILFFIPITSLFIMLVYTCFGIPLNIISITGIAIATGVILDPAIIISEEIKNNNGTEKVTLSPSLIKCLVLGGVTSLTVFIPLLTIESSESKLFEDLGLSFICAILVSTCLPIILFPKLAKYFILPENNNLNPSSSFNGVRILERLTMFFQGKINISWLLMIAMSFGIFLLFPMIEYLPFLGNGTSTVYFKYPQNISTKQAENSYIKPVSQRMNQFERSGSVNEVFLRTWSGGGYGFFRHGEGKEVSDYKDELHKYIGEGLVDFKSSVSPTNLLANYGGEKSITLDIVSDDHDLLKQFLTKIDNYFLEIKPDIYTQVSPDPSRIIKGGEIKLDYSSLERKQVNERDVIALLSASCGGLYIKEIIHEHTRMGLYIKPPECPDVSKILSLPVMNKQGQPVYMSDLVNVTYASKPRSILLKNNQRGYRLKIFLEKEHDSQAELASVQTYLDSLLREFNGQVTYTLSEDSKKIDKLLNKWGEIFLFILFINFLLVCLLCRSLSCGFIVLLGYLPAIFGALALAKIVNLTLPLSFDVITLLGAVLMIGIASNGYIIIAQSFITNVNGPEKMDLESAMASAVSQRLRPIVLTSLSTILALLPLILSSAESSILYRGLATVLVGGILVGTLASITILPNIGISTLKTLKRYGCE